MPENLPEHKLSLSTIDPLPMFALAPDTILATPQLYQKRHDRSKFGIVNLGTLLARMLDGTETLLEPEFPAVHYLGTRSAVHGRVTGRQQWPVRNISETDRAILRRHTVTATRFPKLAYRFTSTDAYYGRPKATTMGAPGTDNRISGVFTCQIERGAVLPKIHEIDDDARIMLANLWGIALCEDAYNARRGRRISAHFPQRPPENRPGVPGRTGQLHLPQNKE